jgi:hypothetical protein
MYGHGPKLKLKKGTVLFEDPHHPYSPILLERRKNLKFCMADPFLYFLSKMIKGIFEIGLEPKICDAQASNAALTSHGKIFSEFKSLFCLASAFDASPDDEVTGNTR